MNLKREGEGREGEKRKNRKEIVWGQVIARRGQEIIPNHVCNIRPL